MQILIEEREDGDEYKASALVGGVLYEITFYRDNIIGAWPYNYKQRAHDAIRRAVSEKT